VVLALLLVSCGDGELPEPSIAPEKAGFFDIDPLFREFYDQLGGIDALGPGISERFSYDGLECQFVAAALLVYDPQAPEHNRHYLAPIGVRMNIAEPPVPQPERNDVRYVNGHIVHPQFLPLYEKLGGVRYVGQPLTEIHYNPNKRRYEQYFENVGFYILESENPEVVRLLSYGAWLCAENCPPKLPSASLLEIPYRTAPEFADTVARLDPRFTGFAISEAYRTPDGYLEQVFESVVLVSDPNQPGRVFLRPITERLGLLPEPLVTPSSDPDMYFYPIQGDNQGYNISKGFMDYIAQHGGREVFGEPIGERHLLKDDVYRQCFQNLCLEEHLGQNDLLPSIRPSQLGFDYREMSIQPVYPNATNQQSQLGGSPDSPPVDTQTQSSVQEAPPAAIDLSNPTPTVEIYTDPQSAGLISIQVWESFPMVASDQNQEIGVSVYTNNIPQSGVEPDILVTLPDGSTRTYYMYPTGEDGQTRMVLDPIVAQSGTLIPYEVCVFFPGGQNLCVKDSFLIW
jgi:hypothetical protein